MFSWQIFLLCPFTLHKYIRNHKTIDLRADTISFSNFSTLPNFSLSFLFHIAHFSTRPTYSFSHSAHMSMFTISMSTMSMSIIIMSVDVEVESINVVLIIFFQLVTSRPCLAVRVV